MMRIQLSYIIKPLLPELVGSGVMIVAICGWQEISAATSPVLRLVGSLVLGTAVYVGYMWWARKEMFYEIRELVGRK